jgi:hypothetical protein
VGVRRGDTLFLYLDGELQAQRPIGDRAVNVLTIRVRQPQSMIQDVQLYDRALSLSDIDALSPAAVEDGHPEAPQAREQRPALPMN